MQSWMFLSSFEELRSKILSSKHIVTMAHLGPRAFDSIAGEVVQSTAFILLNGFNASQRSQFVRLVEGTNESEKSAQHIEACANKNSGRVFYTAASTFRDIPGSPIAYWLSVKLRKAFEYGSAIGEIASPRQGLASSDNGRFLRSWHEVSNKRICFGAASQKEAAQSKRKWFPYNKGGPYRKWYGNNFLVVNWENDGAEILAFAASLYGSPTRTIKNIQFYFKPSITWSAISSGSLSLRQNPSGFLFDTKGQCIFTDDDDLREKVMAFLNSSVSTEMMKVLAPTLDFNSGVVAKVPFLKNDETSKVVSMPLVAIARNDWDNFETSWDFLGMPLLRPELKKATLDESWREWNGYCTAAIRRMQELETENNRLFIAAYGLNGELQPEVPEDQITLARAEAKKDMAAFLSYAVGCMMGRYSLDKPGLILADAGDTLEQYLAKVGKPKEALQFQPDDDGILPVMDVEWFEDDIVSRFEAILVATFGADKLTENIQFIEKSLGADIRSYFLGGFYKDHLQTYKKRPIYWMAQSPKRAFCALIYLHRYTKDTLSLLLNSYLRPYIVKLNSRIEILAQTEVSAGTTREKSAARKELEKLRKYVRECQEWERDVLLPAAQSRIDLDLDDGVKVNYLKLGDVLTPIPGLATKDEE